MVFKPSLMKKDRHGILYGNGINIYLGSGTNQPIHVKEVELQVAYASPRKRGYNAPTT